MKDKGWSVCSLQVSSTISKHLLLCSRHTSPRLSVTTAGLYNAARIPTIIARSASQSQDHCDVIGLGMAWTFRYRYCFRLQERETVLSNLSIKGPLLVPHLARHNVRVNATATSFSNSLLSLWRHNHQSFPEALHTHQRLPVLHLLSIRRCLGLLQAS